MLPNAIQCNAFKAIAFSFDSIFEAIHLTKSPDEAFCLAIRLTDLPGAIHLTIAEVPGQHLSNIIHNIIQRLLTCPGSL